MRTLIRLLILLICLLPAAAHADTFFVATDIHYLSPSLTDHGPFFTRLMERGDGKVTPYIDELTDAFVSQVTRRKPDCLIISGDITFNGAKKSHEEIAEKLREIDRAGVPVYVIPGNHDLYGYSAASFSGDTYTFVDHVTSEQFEAIYHDLGFDDAIERDPYSLSYMTEPTPGIRFLMLDTNTLFSSGAVAQNTFTWLDGALARAQADGVKVIAVSHQNLYAHSSLLYEGYIITNASMLQAMYARYGVSANLSGHVHIQHTLEDQAGPPEIVTSSLCVAPCQYGVIETDGTQAQYHTEIVDVEAWARENAVTDPDLLSFSEYALRFFVDTSVRRSLARSENPADEEAAERMAKVNAAYFAGRMDTVYDEFGQDGTSGEDGSFSSAYLDSMLSEGPKDHTKLTFPL